MTETFFDLLNGSIPGVPVNVLIICAEAPGIMATGDAVPGPKPTQTARKDGIAAFEALRDAATPLAHPAVGGERGVSRRAWQAYAYMMGWFMSLTETRRRHPEKARNPERSSLQTLKDMRRTRRENRPWPGTTYFERSSAFDDWRRNSPREPRRILAVSAMPMTRSSVHADKGFAALRSARRAQNASKELRNG